MESQPQNPEFRINPEKFHPCTSKLISAVNSFLASSDVKLVVIVPRLSRTILTKAIVLTIFSHRC